MEINEKKKKEGSGRKGIKGDWRARYRRWFEIRIAKGKRGRGSPAVPEMNSPFTAVQAKLRANASSLYLAMNELDMTSVARIWRNVPVIDFPFCIGAEITCEPIEPVWEPSPPSIFLSSLPPPPSIPAFDPLHDFSSFSGNFFFLFHRSNSTFRNENEPKMISRRLLLSQLYYFHRIFVESESFESICHFSRKDRLKMNKYKEGNWFVVGDVKRWRARSKRIVVFAPWACGKYYYESTMHGLHHRYEFANNWTVLIEPYVHSIPVWRFLAVRAHATVPRYIFIRMKSPADTWLFSSPPLPPTRLLLPDVSRDWNTVARVPFRETLEKLG